MCVYCVMGDHAFRFNPPWQGPYPQYVPAPLVPVNPWPLEQLKEYYDLLKQVRDLEEQIGCPCEPNKADYIKMFKEKISQLEKK